MNFDSLKEDGEYFEHLGADVWLMDDHRWAFYIWGMHTKSNPSERLNLIHLDYHWDGVNDFFNRPEETEKLVEADESHLYEIVKCNHLIRYDSFIAPAVIRNYLQSIHFYCLQTEGTDEGVDSELLATHKCQQIIYRDYEELAKSLPTGPIVLDLCLDLFNRSDNYYEGDIWPVGSIHQFLDAFTPAIQRAELVTLSLSFGCSGTKADTRRLARHVIPKILERRQ